MHADKKREGVLSTPPIIAIEPAVAIERKEVIMTDIWTVGALAIAMRACSLDFFFDASLGEAYIPQGP